MKIKILRPVIIKGVVFETGKIFDCENSLALELCANYKALKIDEVNLKVNKEIKKKAGSPHRDSPATAGSARREKPALAVELKTN